MEPTIPATIWSQWGPAAVTLAGLFIVGKWMMKFMNGQAKRIEELTDKFIATADNFAKTNQEVAADFNSTVKEHLQESTKAIGDNTRAITELSTYLKMSRNGSSRVGTDV